MVEVITVQQAVHGYRDGHRLLRSSVQLSIDATRTLLVMSDMSGPAMQPGFEEYITGYPLPGTTIYVVAKTWYASEMKRPGCVWSQSLLIEHSSLAKLEEPSTLLGSFRRPSIEDVESSAVGSVAVPLGKRAGATSVAGAAAEVVSALYANDARPVLLLGDTASQFETLALQVWLQQWPRLRAAFSFCTGALAPRVCNGVILDLQVVPRSVSASQYRKAGASAAIVDPRAPAIVQDAGVDVVVADIRNGTNGRFRQWLRACAETESSRSLVGRFARIFRFWEVEQPVEPGQVLQAIGSEFHAAPLAQTTISRLMGELFKLYRDRDGGIREIALLEALAVTTDYDVFNEAAEEIELRTQDLFATHKEACLEMLRRLLACSLSALGEGIVRALLARVSVSDALELSASKPHLLSTMVRANPALACSSDLWSRAPIDRREMLSALASSESMTPDILRGIVDAVIRARTEDIADDLFRATGELGVSAVLCALRCGAMDLDGHWRNALAPRPEAVVGWLQQCEPLSNSDLTLVTKLLSPNDAAIRGRCSTIWAAYIKKSADQNHDAVVASFGLALGLGQSEQIGLVLGFFQPVFDALEANSLEYTAWKWIRDYAPSSLWWREWDKCERLAAAVARRMVEDRVQLPEFFRAVRSETALRQVVRTLDAKRESRSYLESLRRASSREPSLGTTTQCLVLHEDNT